MINMDVEKIREFVTNYANEIKKLQVCADNFSKANQQLEGWDSPVKMKLEANMNRNIPAFDELVDVVLSYANVADNSASLITESENELLRVLE